MNGPRDSVTPGWPGQRWTAGSVWRRGREVLWEQGPRSLWFKLLGETVYRRVIVFERPLDEPTPAPLPPPSIDVRRLTEADIDAYVRLRPDEDRETVRGRLRAGHCCFVAGSDGRLDHVAWAAGAEAPIGYLGRREPLAPGDVYVYSVFTAPHARRRAISTAVAHAMARELGAAGARRLVLVVMPENAPAVAAAAKWRYRRVGRLGCVRLGRWRRQLGSLARPSSGPGDSEYWDRVMRRVSDQPHYLDAFLGEMKRQAHLRLARRWECARPGGRVLKTDSFEEAVGPDAFLADVARETGAAVGMDISPVVVRQARARTREAPVCWAVTDVRSLGFADGAFSTIVSTSTLDHFAGPDDFRASLRELYRALEPGGHFVITLDNPQNLLDPLLRLADRLGWLPYCLGWTCHVGDLRRELASAGFEVRETTAILHNPRLLAVGLVRLARLTRVRALTAAVERLLRAAQRLEHTRWRFYTGSFIAALAVRPPATLAVRPASSRAKRGTLPEVPESAARDPSLLSG